MLGAITSTSVSGLWDFLDWINDTLFPGNAVVDGDARYAYLNGTSMAAPHAAGVAALVKEMHPNWGPSAIKAAVQRSAQHLDCPANWEPIPPVFPDIYVDERERCYGKKGRTSFFGHGLVDADAAAQE